MTTRRRTRPFSRWLDSPPPSAAVEVAPGRVTAVSAAHHADSVALTGHATVGLGAGVIAAALNAPNVHDEPVVAAAIRSALDKLSPRPRRIGLVLPDTVAKVSLVRFEKVPPRVQDLDQLIRWQVRKAAPFRIEDAQVAWVPAHTFADGAQEFLVTMARRDVIASYENACTAAGAYPGIVDIASFNVINVVIAGGERAAGDWLLVHATSDYATLAVVRDGHLIFFRNRATGDDVDLADLVHQTAMYHEDRLGGGGFSRIVLAGATALGADQAERLRRQIEERTGTRPDAVGFGTAVTLRDRIAAAPELVDTIAPAIGLLLREGPGGRASGERVA